MIHHANIIIHVLAGIIAMLIGVGAYASAKGGNTHKRFGRWFLYLMAVVIVTALNGVIFFRDRPFLTVVTFLSFYMAYSGFRVLKTKDKGFARVDFLVMIVVLVILGLFVNNFRSANILWNPFVVYYLSAYLGLVLLFDISRFLKPNLIRNPRFWLYDHIWKMTGAFSALISAGAGTVFSEYEPLNQIVPAVVTSIWLIFCLVYFPKKMKQVQLSNEPKNKSIST